MVLHLQELALLVEQPMKALAPRIRLRTPPLPVGIVAGVLLLLFTGTCCLSSGLRVHYVIARGPELG